MWSKLDKRALAPIVFIVAGVLLFGFIYSLNNKKSENVTNDVTYAELPAAQPEVINTPSPEPKKAVVHNISDTVAFGDYEVNVKDVNSADGSEEGSKSIEVRIKVKNVGKEPINIDSSYFLLYDQDERKFEPSDLISFTDDPSFMYDDINPGLSLTRKVVFEVPDDVSTAKIAMRDNMFDLFESAEYMYIDLGEIK